MDRAGAEEASMKIFLSSDMEGTAGVVDWEQCIGDGPEAMAGRQLLLDEVNAAIEGALAGGATEIVVNDSHSQMRNLPPQALAGQASYISGRHKPLYMMQGLDGSFGAALFVSYHGSVGAAAGLSHTYNPRAVAEVRLNGTVTGEAGINALVAAHHEVPVVLVTGDRCACEETVALLPGVHAAVVKDPVGRLAAHSLHPAVPTRWPRCRARPCRRRPRRRGELRSARRADARARACRAAGRRPRRPRFPCPSAA
jgi:D-amino peptidase